MAEIREELFRLRDSRYRDFQKGLLPTVDPEKLIGVRTPALRLLAKQVLISDACGDYLRGLPHRYFDEDQLHGFIISQMKDYDRCMTEVERFLPFVDNWATCDQLSPVVFKKHRKELLAHISPWIASGKTYVMRFAIGMLMQHYLDEDFDEGYPEMVSAVRSEEYYVNMMIAWYFATALAKQYEAVLPFLVERRLDAWTHNKAIQKAAESRRIREDQKEFLKSLKTSLK
ncbi:MAG: DNA alkylation repair protein [Mailhella sp.]|nr:DNA alkylation repair protein [Mailhella sp.]